MADRDAIALRRRGLLWLVVLALALAWAGRAAPAAGPKDILLLYSYNQDNPAQTRMSAGLGQAIAARHLQLGQMHSEYLDINPPRTPGQRQRLAALLLDKFAGLRFALIITVFEPARDFLEHEGAGLSPGSPALVLFAREPGRLPGRPQANLPLHYDQEGTLRLAMALFPATRHVLYWAGTTETAQRLEAQARQAFRPWADRVTFDYANARPVEQVLAQAARMPPDSLVFFSVVTTDGSGRIFVPQDLARRLGKVANAPVFTISATYMGEGILGGSLADLGRAGVAVASAIADAQAGHPAMPPDPALYTRPMFDWAEIRRWGLDPALLPAGTVFINRPPTLWGQYRGFVLGGATIILVLAVLSLALLVENRRRAGAEAALAESERFLREAQEAAQLGTFTWDLRTGLVRASAGLVRISGAPGQPVDTARSWCRRVPAGQRKAFLRGMRETLAGRAGFDQEVPLRATGDAQPLWVHCRAAMERGADGAPARVLGTAQDITERHRLREELEHIQRLESLGRLASGIAHDMNNVLASIQAVTQVAALRPMTGPEAAKAMATVGTAADRGRGLVQRLVNFARRDLREARILDLNDLVREQASILQQTLLQKTRIDLELAPDLLQVRGEASSLASVLMNLCVNAVDAMPGGGTLTLRTRMTPEGQVELAVADTGVGMTPEVARKAMEPFFTTKPYGKGTGLGLSMVFNTIRAHGGEVRIQSRPGAGTTLVLHLPAAAGPAPAAAAPRATGWSGRPLRILLVDDDELILATVPAMLRNAGHQVEVAAGGAQGLALLASGLAVDLVLLDLNMPGLNGVETLQALRRLRPQLPVLVATGFLDDSTEAVIAAIPAAAMVTKPYTLEQFQAKARELKLLEEAAARPGLAAPDPGRP